MKKSVRTTFLFSAAFFVLTALTSFLPTQSRQYYISISFPETNSSFTDTIEWYVSDCYHTMSVSYSSKYFSESSNSVYYTKYCKISLQAHIILLNSATGTADTVKQYSLCNGQLPLDFFNTLNGQYILKVIPFNTIYKPFETTLKINSKTDKGRKISVTLGNIPTTHTYKIVTPFHDKLTKKQKNFLKQTFLNWGIEGICENKQLNIQDTLHPNRTVIIGMEK